MAPSDKAPLPGDGPAMRELRDRIRQVAYASIPVLIVGEVGSDRGSVARDLHRQSPAAGGRWSGWTAPAFPKTF